MRKARHDNVLCSDLQKPPKNDDASQTKLTITKEQIDSLMMVFRDELKMMMKIKTTSTVAPARCPFFNGTKITNY
jgi:hypothetical protein